MIGEVVAKVEVCILKIFPDETNEKFSRLSFCASFSDLLDGVSCGSLNKYPYHVNLLNFTSWLHGVEFVFL